MSQVEIFVYFFCDVFSYIIGVWSGGKFKIKLDGICGYMYMGICFYFFFVFCRVWFRGIMVFFCVKKSFKILIVYVVRELINFD